MADRMRRRGRGRRARGVRATGSRGRGEMRREGEKEDERSTTTGGARGDVEER